MAGAPTEYDTLLRLSDHTSTTTYITITAVAMTRSLAPLALKLFIAAIRYQPPLPFLGRGLRHVYPLCLALHRHRILFAWAIFCIAIFGGLPAFFRVAFAKCDIADPQDRMVEIALNTLRGWEYSLLAGLTVVLWNTIWFRFLEGHPEYTYDVWVAFVLRQTADYFMWSIIISLLTSTMYNRIHDLILHPHRGHGVCRISFDWRPEDAWMFQKSST